MVTIHNASANELIQKTADELKRLETMKMPEWALFIKTGTSRERTPYQEDWWYLRAASILRAVYIKGPVGVNKLRVKYGGKKNRGHKTEHFYKSSGKIIRVVLQQLETSGFLQKKAVGVHKGRMVTNSGKSFLDKIASVLVKAAPKRAPEPAVKPEVAKPEAKVAKPEAAPKAAKPEVKAAKPEVVAKVAEPEAAAKAAKPEPAPKEKKDVKDKEPKQKDKAGEEA
jgi:small subunit ribosomal protein S19e